MKNSTAVLISLIVALAAGAAIAALGNPTLLGVADWFAPIGAIWINAIRMTIIPLVVSLLITGVASATNLKAIGRIGGRTLLVFGAMLAGLALVMLPVMTVVQGMLPPSLANRPPLAAGGDRSRRAARLRWGCGQSPVLVRLAHPAQSDFRCGQRTDGFLHSVHTLV